MKNLGQDQIRDNELISEYVVDFEDTKDWFLSDHETSKYWIQESRLPEFQEISIGRQVHTTSILQEYLSEESDELDIALEEVDFSRKLIRLIENEPIEDGYCHPGEQLIENALLRYDSISPRWIESIYTKNLAPRPTVSASILRCVGRLPKDLVSPWGISMADEALLQKNVEIREASVRAFEIWGGQESLDALRKYIETERVSWLANYANQVISNLLQLD